jgi:hypothetical protein
MYLCTENKKLKMAKPLSLNIHISIINVLRRGCGEIDTDMQIAIELVQSF